MVKDCERCTKLTSIILDIHWMARRYADGRRSYAGSMFNEAMDRALALGLPLKQDTALKATYYAEDADLGVWQDGRFVRKPMSKEDFHVI